jgi:hypothetical protein
MNDTTIKQVGPITVYNPSTDDDSEPQIRSTCVCCGEECDSVGNVCLDCGFADCDVSFDEPCSRTGVVDPCDLDHELMGLE